MARATGDWQNLVGGNVPFNYPIGRTIVAAVRGLVLVLGLLALAGCGGGAGDETPSDFAVRVLGLLEAGEAGQAWEELHPAHREAIPRALYVRCEGTDGLGGGVERIDVAAVRDEPAVVPGVGEQPSTEVALRFELGGEPVELDMHVFEVDGEWAWVVGGPDHAAYSAGRCP